MWHFSDIIFLKTHSVQQALTLLHIVTFTSSFPTIFRYMCVMKEIIDIAERSDINTSKQLQFAHS